MTKDPTTPPPTQRFTLTCHPYARIPPLKKALRSEGIDCGESDGCLAIYIQRRQRGQMRRLCYALTGEYPLRDRRAAAPTLTPEEEAQFTTFNAAAFDLLRVNGQKSKTVMPCWLCMSEAARQEARRDLVAHLNQRMDPVIPYTEDTIEKRLFNEMRTTMAPKVAAWRASELEYKRLRADNNPRAFFAQ